MCVPFSVSQLSVPTINLRLTNKKEGELMIDLVKHKNRKEAYYKTTGKVIYDEELDFIINYDIKFRMGADDSYGKE